MANGTKNKTQQVSESLMQIETGVSDCYETQIRTFGSADLDFLGNLIHTYKIKNILDVGCGEGSFILNFAKSFPKIEIHAVENNASLISECQKHKKQTGNNNVSFQQVLFDDHFPQSSFDMITARFAVEHMQNIQNFVASVHNHLKFKGVIAITEYCVLTTGIQEPLWLEFRERELALYKHIQSHAQVSFEIPHQLQTAGFKNISSHFVQISPSTINRNDFYDLVDAYTRIYHDLDPVDWPTEFANRIFDWSKRERDHSTCDPTMWLTQTKAEKGE